MAQTSIKLDCTTCDGTGYENFWSDVSAVASYRPGPRSRWNAIEGRVDYFGECSIKLDYKYKALLDTASFIVMDEEQWKFSVLRTPGEAMGQRRLVLLLSRK